ncbi:8266_t:CDS:2, partial [Paraglomus occultum]
DYVLLWLEQFIRGREMDDCLSESIPKRTCYISEHAPTLCGITFPPIDSIVYEAEAGNGYGS